MLALVFSVKEGGVGMIELVVVRYVSADEALCQCIVLLMIVLWLIIMQIAWRVKK